MRNIFFYTLFFLLLSISPVQAERIKTIEGKELSHIISQNKGKTILINIFATWCPSCRSELPTILSIREKYTEDALVVIGISLDENSQKLKNFVKESRINYPVYIAGTTIPVMFLVKAIPHNVIYNTEGKMVVNEAGMLSEQELNNLLKKYIKK